MNIPEVLEKGKSTAIHLGKAIFWPALSILVTALTLGSYTVWQLQKLKVPVTTDPAPLNLQIPDKTFLATSTIPHAPTLKLFVASKRGTTYYYPWCTGAKNISEANKVWFETQAAAKAAGYTPNKSCKDLQATSTHS